MSHKHEDIICPNCGYHASENYCARCGQETHLHNENFFGLIMHFIGHYFHYDSKFWQTLKALWFSPGKLTIAYRNRQRMRYIPPISLYIFISAVFFLVAAMLPSNKHIKSDENTSEDTVSIRQTVSDEVTKSKHRTYKYAVSTVFDEPVKDKKSIGNANEIWEKASHHMPKIFFFMIPLMGFILQLLFLKRKEFYYVDHVIYALHYHSFWFSILMFDNLYVFEKGSAVVSFIIFSLSVMYSIVALRNVYNVSWKRAVAYSVITAIFYAIFVLIAIVSVFVILFPDLFRSLSTAG